MRKHLGLFLATVALAIVMPLSLFAANEQGPPGNAKPSLQLEAAYISTTPTGLAGDAFVAAAALGTFTVLTWMVGARLRRSDAVAGRVNALYSLMKKTSAYAGLAVQLFMQSHVQTSRSSLTT